MFSTPEEDEMGSPPSAAALTDEQRDVLTVWEWARGADRRLHITKWEGNEICLWIPGGGKRLGDWKTFTTIHAAAAWVREQGAKGER